MVRRIATLFMVALSASVTTTPLLATSTADAPTRPDNAAWQTCASAPVKALKFFDVGEARLARDDCSTRSPLTPPLQLTFAYHRAIPGDAMAKAALVMVERNLEQAQFEKLAPRLRAFSSGYRDISSGDQYVLRYNDDGSLSLWLNDQLLRSEQGHDFARAYLSIWFGPEPYSDELKQRLLAIN